MRMKTIIVVEGILLENFSETNGPSFLSNYDSQATPLIICKQSKKNQNFVEMHNYKAHSIQVIPLCIILMEELMNPSGSRFFRVCEQVFTGDYFKVAGRAVLFPIWCMVFAKDALKNA